MNMIDVIVFAAVAAFVLYKLRKMLGEEYVPDNTQTQNSKDIVNASVRDLKKQNKIKLLVPGIKPKINEPEFSIEAEQVTIQSKQNIDPATMSNLIKVYSLVSGFTYAGFLQGATTVFESVIEAYSSGNIHEIKGFLSDSVAAKLESAIVSNMNSNLIEKAYVAKLISSLIENVVIADKQIKIAVKFETIQINYTQNINSQDIVSGSKTMQNRVSETWIFAKGLESNQEEWYVDDIAINSH